MNDAERAMCNNITVAGSHPAKYNVFEVVEKVLEDGIAGCFVEAGACGGGQIAVMDRALQKHNVSRSIHAFDSWDGIPKATEEDDPPQKAEYGVRAEGEPLASSGKLLSSIEGFWQNMRAWGARHQFIQTHKGWLQNTLQDWHEPIALLRIDVDLTDSVRACAKYLYPYLVKGGYCIFDDWYTSWSPQRQVMIDMSGLSNLAEIAIPVDGNPGTVWWRKP